MATILVADDYACIRLLVRAIFGDEHEILEAADGSEVLRLVRERRPDLILLDAVMPGLDGFAVCWTLKDDPTTRDVPIVFLTALDEPCRLKRTRAAIADGYVTKPFSPLALMATVQRVLAGKPIP